MTNTEQTVWASPPAILVHVDAAEYRVNTAPHILFLTVIWYNKHRNKPGCGKVADTPFSQITSSKMICQNLARMTVTKVGDTPLDSSHHFLIPLQRPYLIHLLYVAWITVKEFQLDCPVKPSTGSKYVQNPAASSHIHKTVAASHDTLQHLH